MTGLTGLAWTADQESRESAIFVGSLVLTGLSAILIILGLAYSSVDLNDYGLLDSFPLIFYFGLALLPLASAPLWFTRRKVDAIVVGQLVLLLVALWLSPYIIESTVRFRSGYKNFAAVDWIVGGDGFNPDVIVYHNWPLFPSVMAAILKLFSLTPTAMMGIFPFAINLAYLIPLVFLMRRLWGPDNRLWAGVWFFYLFNWTGQDYFSPQAFAFLLFLGLLAVFAHVVTRRDGQFGWPSMAATLGLFGAIVMAHLLTAILALAVMIALHLAGRLKQPTILVTALLMFVAWQVYGAFSYFDDNHSRALSNVLDPESFFSDNVENRLEGADGHVIVGRLRILVTLVAFTLGGLGILVWIGNLRSGRYKLPRLGRGLEDVFKVLDENRVVFGQAASSQVVLFAVPALMGIGVIVPVFVYGGEMLIRMALFSLPSLAMLFVLTVSWRFAAVPALVILAAVTPLHIVTHYGNELYDYVSPEEVEGIEFVSSELPAANVIGGYPAAAFENTKDLDWRQAVEVGENRLPSARRFLTPDEFNWREDDWPIYVALSRGDDAAAYLFYNQQGFVERSRSVLDRRCDFRLVFDNEDFAVYRWYDSCAEARSSTPPSEMSANLAQ